MYYRRPLVLHQAAIRNSEKEGRRLQNHLPNEGLGQRKMMVKQQYFPMIGKRPEHYRK